MLPQAIEILERWSVNIKNANEYIFTALKIDLSKLQKQKDKAQFVKTINKYMNRIGEDIGYDKPLTTYTAWHSFETIRGSY